jgi:hypothetical protein
MARRAPGRLRTGHTTLRRNPHLYEISVWPWLEQLSRQEGRRITLGKVPDSAWSALAEQGFDLIYLMGVWRRSARGREIARSLPALMEAYDRVLPDWTLADVPGSPYSIAAYEPDPHVGTWSELDAVRRRLHALGMRLVLDFVPNHTGFDHRWIASHPDWYVTAPLAVARTDPSAFRPIETERGEPLYVACGRDPFFPPWTDVAQLDYFNPDARRAMLDTLGDISRHCDGVRCDMAMLVLNDVFARTWGHLVRSPAPAGEFWGDVASALPKLILIAEVYWDLEWRLQQLGFAYTYDKRLRDRLLQDSAAGVRQHLQAEPAFQSRLARFLENHDEPRSAAVFGRDRFEAAAVTFGTTPGLRFYFDGQLDGRRVHAPVQLGRWPDEAPDPSVRELYARLLGAANARVLHEGEWTLLDLAPAGDDTFQHLLSWRWRSTDELRVIVVNLSGSVAQGHVRIASDILASGPPSLVFADVIGGGRFTWDRDVLREGGLYVRLDAGRAHVFEVGQPSPAARRQTRAR